MVVGIDIHATIATLFNLLHLYIGMVMPPTTSRSLARTLASTDLSMVL